MQDSDLGMQDKDCFVRDCVKWRLLCVLAGSAIIGEQAKTVFGRRIIVFNLNFLNGRKRFLENRIREICEMLPTLPEGQLSISIRKGRPYYYVCGLKDSKGKTSKKYITKDNESFAAALAQKAYLKEQLRCDRKQLKALDRFMKDYESGSITKVRFKHPEHFFSLLRQKLPPRFEECQKILNSMFVCSTKRAGEKRFATLSGIMVRSKSEVEIANMLYRLHIPFLYEPIIVINGIEYAPDFIIMIPSTGMLYMWEHFGMMDDPDYVRKNLGKIEVYAQKGWILGQNLIVTTETYDSPFNVEKAEYALRQAVPFLDKESA